MPGRRFGWWAQFLAASAAPFAALPWMRYSFSLRALLIATTLVAMVLGLIVWMRSP